MNGLRVLVFDIDDTVVVHSSNPQCSRRLIAQWGVLSPWHRKRMILAMVPNLELLRQIAHQARTHDVRIAVASFASRPYARAVADAVFPSLVPDALLHAYSEDAGVPLTDKSVHLRRIWDEVGRPRRSRMLLFDDLPPVVHNAVELGYNAILVDPDQGLDARAWRAWLRRNG